MKKYFALITRFIHSLTRPVPAREWALALGVTVLLGIAMIGTAVYFYIGLESGAIIVAPPPAHQSPPSFSRDDLTKLVGTYQTRAVNYGAGNISVPKLGL